MTKTQRTILYVIYEETGILDDWYEQLFQEFKKLGSYLLCVVNGSLNNTGKELVNKYFNKAIYRENKGYDVTAYKEGILYLYRENLLDKELVMCNNSFFAPIYPFDDMFNKMADKEYDFWGITSVLAHGKIPFHIQSYFYLFKENVVKSYKFIEFFKNIKEIKHYQDAVESVELKLTNYLLDCGFKAGSYMDTVVNSPYRHDQLSLIKNGCPVIKRRQLVFSKKYGYNHGLSNINLFDYIEKNTTFQVEQIYKNLLKSFPYDQIDYCINNSQIISDVNIEENHKSYKVKYIISYNDKSNAIIKKLQNKYEFIDNIEYIETDKFQKVLDYLKNLGGYDLYLHIGMVYRDFLSEDINFLLMEHLYLSLIGSNTYHHNLCSYMLSKSWAGMAIPSDFLHGIKINHIIKNKNQLQKILKLNNIKIPQAKEINLLALSSSFIIKNSILEEIKEIDYSLLGNSIISYINGGMLLRYIAQANGIVTEKVAGRQQITGQLNNYVYKYHNHNLEDIIKSWWLTRKLRNKF